MRHVGLGLWIMCLLAISGNGSAQVPDPEPLQTGPHAAPKIPPDACFYATLNLKDVIAMPQLQLVPWEIIQAAGIDNWGFDPLAIQRLDLVVGILPPGGHERRVQFVIVARTDQLLHPKQELLDQLLASDLSFAQLNERFIMVGDYSYMKRLVNQPAADGELKRQIARIGDSSVAWCVLVFGPIQAEIEEMIAQAPEDGRAELATILKKSRLLAARYDLNRQWIPVVLETDSPADASEVEMALEKLKALIVQNAPIPSPGANEQLPERIKTAVGQYHDRFREEYQRVMTPKRNGARLTFVFDQNFYQLSQMGTNASLISAFLQVLDANISQ